MDTPLDGSASSHSATNAANEDSPIPAVTTVSYNVVGTSKCRRNRGSTSWVIRPSISYGTPGMLTTTLPPGRSNHMPDAVPNGLGNTVHASGSIACKRFTSRKGTLRDSNQV